MSSLGLRPINVSWVRAWKPHSGPPGQQAGEAERYMTDTIIVNTGFHDYHGMPSTQEASGSAVCENLPELAGEHYHCPPPPILQTLGELICKVTQFRST